MRKKFTMLLASLLACVGVVKAQTLISDASQLRNEKVYTVKAACNATAGAWSVASDASKMSLTIYTNEDPNGSTANQRFAFLNYGEHMYLYSIGAKKFVQKSGNGQALSKEVSADSYITFAASNETPDQGHSYTQAEYPMVVYVGGSALCSTNQSHFSGNGGLVTNWNSKGDSGNAVAIVEHEPTTEELAAIAEGLSLLQTVELTINYSYGNENVGQKKLPAQINANFTIPTLDYTKVSACTMGGVEQAVNDGVCTVTVPTTNATINVALADNLPFTVSTSYDNATWYAMQIRGSKYVVRSTEGPYTNSATTPTTADALWAFVGNPIDGVQVLNKAAGAGFTLGLDGETVATETNVVMKEGSTTWKILKGNGGFVLRQGSEGNNYVHDYGSKLQIWQADGAATDNGSAFVVKSEADMKTLATTALNNAKAQVAVYDEADYYTYSQEAVTAAKTALDAIATPADMLTALTAKNGVESAMATLTATTKGAAAPAVGDYIRLKNKQHGGFLKANDANLTNSADTDLSTLWLVEEGSEGAVKLKSVGNNKYIGEIRMSAEVAMVESANAKEFAWTNQTESYAVFKETTGGDYAYGHISGGKLVGWLASADATQWIVSKVEYSASYKVVYEYQYEEETVATQETYILAGDEYPDFTYAGPYGVVVADAKPEGQVTKDETLQIALEIVKELPFDAVAEGTPTTWYYAQMHAFPGYGFYISANEDNLVWHGANDENAHKIADNANVDNYLWGFVGNLWEGYKMVNKAGKAVCSTGSGEVSVGELAEATTLIAWNSQANGEWFCLKSSNNYLNLNTANTVINHWSANDNGSSIFLTEFNKTYSLEVTAAGYATYYSQYRLAIPETVKAYVVSEVEGAYAVLEQVTGVLPAYTGVIIEGKEGTYEFVTSAAAPATIASNKLKGTIVNTEVSDNAYILADGVDGVGLYKVELTDGKFTNNANKAYLPASAIASANAPMLSFNRGEGTTSIDELSTVSEQQTTVIYDLTGRRVEKMEKGIYIVNGRKVIVK